MAVNEPKHIRDTSPLAQYHCCSHNGTYIQVLSMCIDLNDTLYGIQFQLMCLKCCAFSPFLESHEMSFFLTISTHTVILH